MKVLVHQTAIKIQYEYIFESINLTENYFLQKSRSNNNENTSSKTSHRRSPSPREKRRRVSPSQSSPKRDNKRHQIQISLIFSIKSVHNLYSSFFFCLALFFFSLFLLCVCEIRPKEEIQQHVYMLLIILDFFSLFYFHFARVYHCCLCLYCVFLSSNF